MICHIHSSYWSISANCFFLVNGFNNFNQYIILLTKWKEKMFILPSPPTSNPNPSIWMEKILKSQM